MYQIICRKGLKASKGAKDELHDDRDSAEGPRSKTEPRLIPKSASAREEVESGHDGS